MAGHSGEKRWITGDGMTGVSEDVQVAVGTVYDSLQNAEDTYQELLEIRAFAGGTDQLLADQLFGTPENPTASADQVTMVTDAKNAMVACHALFEAMTGLAVTTEDRVPALRRMNG